MMCGERLFFAFPALRAPFGKGETGKRTGNATHKKSPAKAVGKTGKRQDDTKGTADENSARYQFFHGLPCRGSR